MEKVILAKETEKEEKERFFDLLFTDYDDDCWQKLLRIALKLALSITAIVLTVPLFNLTVVKYQEIKSEYTYSIIEQQISGEKEENENNDDYDCLMFIAPMLIFAAGVAGLEVME